eukprot:5540320-Lingulodinium_polyedra.AAC.1
MVSVVLRRRRGAAIAGVAISDLTSRRAWFWGRCAGAIPARQAYGYPLDICSPGPADTPTL